MRRSLLGPVSLACAAILACGGGGGGGGGGGAPPPGPVATFLCSDSPAAPDQVVMKCAAKASADVWEIAVVIGVPTTSKDINGFAFDVVFDPLLLAYVPGSAQAGNLLFQNVGTPLFAAATDPGDPGRLVVGISKPGSQGVAGVPGYELIMIFEIKSLTASPFGPEMVKFEHSRAFDSSDVPIP